MTTTRTPTTARTSKRSIALAALATAAVVSLANLAVASISLALGTPSVLQLTPGPYITFSVVAGVVGAIGWALIRDRARNPRRLLGILATVTLVASLLPLIALGASVVPDLGWAPIITLALMHVVSVGVAVATLAVLLPVSTGAVEATPSQGHPVG